MRLALLSVLIAVPIVSLTTWQYKQVGAKMSQAANERKGLAFIVQAIDVLEIQSAHLGGIADAAERDAIEQRVSQLEDNFASIRTLDVSTVDLKAVRRRWNAVQSDPTSASAANLSDALVAAIGRMSDASGLSFESQVDAANLSDALYNEYLTEFQRLSLAGAIAERTQPGSAAVIEDRIAIARYLAEVDDSKEPLTIDMVGAFRANPGLRGTLQEPWQTAAAEVDALRAPLGEVVAGKRVGRGVPLLIAQRNAVLLERSARFDRALSAAVDGLLAARIAACDRGRRLIVASALLGALLLGLVLVLIGRAIVRRDRKELRLAQHELRAFDAKLAQLRAERALVLTEAQFRAVFDRSQMGIALLDRAGATLECNQALERMLGSPTQALVEVSDAAFRQLLDGHSDTYKIERRLARADGTSLWADITVSPVADRESDTTAAIAMVADATVRKDTEDRLRFAASHDALTSLPNRAEFLRRLSEVVAQGSANYAVLYLDLDDFKVVNDSLGHPAGDRALLASAHRLSATARAGDLVARFHGDEFAILLRDITDAEAARAAAGRIQNELQAPISFDGPPLSISASIGIVLGHGGYERAEDIIRDADAAMYNAKKLGRARALVFDEAMHESFAMRMRIKMDLRTAIDDGQFFLAYQPVVDLATSRAVGFEALLRWRHPVHGNISPADFVPIAEESTAILDLGRFALREACRWLAERDRLHPEAPQLTVSVNLSVPQVLEGGIVHDVRQALAETGLGGHRLMLEITESTLLDNSARAAAVLSGLKALGVRLCIDDFGTGYSSLRYLHEFPIDVLKIDRSFVHGPDGRIANEPIVQMLLTLARALNMTVIAEGIESPAQHQELLAEGCAFGQGFLFSKPLDGAEMARWLETTGAPTARPKLRIAHSS